jgi:hypothetical protein
VELKKLLNNTSQLLDCFFLVESWIKYSLQGAYDGYNSLERFHTSPTTRVGIFILLNNSIKSHHYTLVEECTINILLQQSNNSTPNC